MQVFLSSKDNEDPDFGEWERFIGHKELRRHLKFVRDCLDCGECRSFFLSDYLGRITLHDSLRYVAAYCHELAAATSNGVKAEERFRRWAQIREIYWGVWDAVERDEDFSLTDLQEKRVKEDRLLAAIGRDLRFSNFFKVWKNQRREARRRESRRVEDVF